MNREDDEDPSDGAKLSRDTWGDEDPSEGERTARQINLGTTATSEAEDGPTAGDDDESAVTNPLVQNPPADVNGGGSLFDDETKPSSLLSRPVAAPKRVERVFGKPKADDHRSAGSSSPLASGRSPTSSQPPPLRPRRHAPRLEPLDKPIEGPSYAQWEDGADRTAAISEHRIAKLRAAAASDPDSVYRNRDEVGRRDRTERDTGKALPAVLDPDVIESDEA